MARRQKSKSKSKGKYWTSHLKKGTYTEQLIRLGLIKKGEYIPLEISRKICSTEEGAYTRIRGKVVHVTPLLKKRACAHLALVKMARRRRKRR